MALFPAGSVLLLEATGSRSRSPRRRPNAGQRPHPLGPPLAAGTAPMAPSAPTAPPHRQAPSAATCAAACSARGVAPLPLRRQLEASLTNGILAELEADASFALPPSWTAGFRAGARQIIAELSLPQLQTIARRYGPPPPALAGSAHRTPQLPAQGRPRTAPRPASPPLTPIPVIQVLPPVPRPPPSPPSRRLALAGGPATSVTGPPPLLDPEAALDELLRQHHRPRP